MNAPIEFAKASRAELNRDLNRFASIEGIDARPPERRYAQDGYELVRYYSMSKAMQTDARAFLKATGMQRFDLSGFEGWTAIFGVRRIDSGRPIAFLLIDPARRTNPHDRTPDPALEDELTHAAEILARRNESTGPTP